MFTSFDAGHWTVLILFLLFIFSIVNHAIWAEIKDEPESSDVENLAQEATIVHLETPLSATELIISQELNKTKGLKLKEVLEEPEENTAARPVPVLSDTFKSLSQETDRLENRQSYVETTVPTYLTETAMESASRHSVERSDSSASTSKQEETSKAVATQDGPPPVDWGAAMSSYGTGF